MRLIKFRGKRFTNGEWVYGSLIAFDGFCQIVVPPKGDDPFENCSIAVIPESIGQYTGVNDIEGHEIYEDDLIFYAEGEIRHVIFAGYSFGVLNKDNSFGSYHTWRQGLIAGNFHDNPELLSK